MQIIWSERALARRQAIEDYIFYSFGYEAYRSYLIAINEWKAEVSQYPQAGQIEPLLLGMRKEYRSRTIDRFSKCIYYIEGDRIVFVDWWDTRRSPIILKSGLNSI